MTTLIRSRADLIADIRKQAGEMVKREALAALERIVAAKPWVDSGGIVLRPTLDDATNADKQGALAYATGVTRAWARREATRLDLFDKYAPGGSIADIPNPMETPPA